MHHAKLGLLFKNLAYMNLAKLDLLFKDLSTPR